MKIVLARYDGAFFIGEATVESLAVNIFINPAIVLHTPITVQSRIGDHSGIAYQTSIIFIESETFLLPASIVITELNPTDALTKHYLAALDIYKKTRPDFSSSTQKH